MSSPATTLGAASPGGRAGASAVSSSTPLARPLVFVGAAFVWLLVFSSFYVLREPAPYELLGVAVIGTGFLFGLRIPRAVLPLLGLLMIYILCAFIGVTFAPNLAEARFQVLVTAFLASTSVFFACYTARDTLKRTGMLVNAWQCGAICASLFGLAGYFNVAGTFDLFTLYGRARGTFQDPNVFGPFVIGAVVFAVFAILSHPMNRWLFPILVIVICSLGILLSFSRGAWGYTLLACGIVTALHFILSTNPAERLRILSLVVVGAGIVAAGIITALSIPQIGDLFTVRANLIQDYDAGELWRFGRHILGFQLSIHHPLGLGALGFREVFGIDPHNVYLNALMTHGWLGFFAYLTLVITTLVQLVRVILFNPPLRSLAIPLFALFLGLALVGTFIDTDRWRHFFLLLGLYWGTIAASVANPFVPASAAERVGNI